MALIEKKQLLDSISPPLNHLLASQLLDEFVSAERRFIQRDWEPAELDGGQFCEILSRIFYHLDSNNLNLSKSFEDCCKYLEGESVTHSITPRHDVIHVVKVLKTIYKFRSQRGAVHISPNYKPNHMDSKLVIECVRWCMNETLRIFWQGDRDKVAKAIRELLQFDVPCIGVFEDTLLVQRTDLTVEEELILLIHYGGELGISRSDLGKYAKGAPSTITLALQKLESPSKRQVIKLKSGCYRLTDIGSKRVREQLSSKLLLE